jgi:hypothetical protein
MEYRPNGRLGRSTSSVPGLGSVRAEGAGELLLERTKTLQAGRPPQSPLLCRKKM